MPRSQNNINEKINAGDEIRKLIEERRSTAEGDRHRGSKKCIRDKKKELKILDKIQRILETFRGIKKDIMHKIWKKENAHPEVKNDKGETITPRKGIAKAFGEFYSKLFAEERFGEEVQDPHKPEARTNTEGESCNDDVKNEIPDFTQDEVQTAIDSVKKR